METSILFVNYSENETPETHEALKEKAQYSDNATLLKVINALLENNKALKKYIEILEKQSQI